LIALALKTIADAPEVRVDYLAAVDWGTLEPVERVGPGTLFAIAAWAGATRLIDNCVF